MVDFGNPDIRIQDVMTVNPIITKKGESITTAAKLMKESGVGSLLVLDDDGKLEGIITEMDIVFDLVAEGKDPDEITVGEIMSSPVHTIEGNKDIQQAAEIMAEMNIRRLPVMRDDELAGVITENDIIEISPALLDITREYARIQSQEQIDEYQEPQKIQISGYCESCSVYSDKLTIVNGQLLCPECVT
ncbi:MAG: CBS domain-containing protein [Thermoplasmata archaeon]